MALDPPTERHLLRARDLADRHYAEAITVASMAEVAAMSQAHFARSFKATFGISPHGYLLTRRLERAAALLRNTDYPVIEICLAVGLCGLGSFTTSFGRMYGCSPTEYRRKFPHPANLVTVPGCVVRAYGRPALRTYRDRSFREAGDGPDPVPSSTSTD